MPPLYSHNTAICSYSSAVGNWAWGERQLFSHCDRRCVAQVASREANNRQNSAHQFDLGGNRVGW